VEATRQIQVIHQVIELYRDGTNYHGGKDFCVDDNGFKCRVNSPCAVSWNIVGAVILLSATYTEAIWVIDSIYKTINRIHGTNEFISVASYCDYVSLNSVRGILFQTINDLTRCTYDPN
jgi:hypothetical protein